MEATLWTSGMPWLGTDQGGVTSMTTNHNFTLLITEVDMLLVVCNQGTNNSVRTLS